MKKSKRLHLTQVLSSSIIDLCNAQCQIMHELDVPIAKFRRITVDAMANAALDLLMTMALKKEKTQEEAADMLFNILNKEELSRRIDKNKVHHSLMNECSPLKDLFEKLSKR